MFLFCNERLEKYISLLLLVQCRWFGVRYVIYGGHVLIAHLCSIFFAWKIGSDESLSIYSLHHSHTLH